MLGFSSLSAISSKKISNRHVCFYFWSSYSEKLNRSAVVPVRQIVQPGYASSFFTFFFL